MLLENQLRCFCNAECVLGMSGSLRTQKKRGGRIIGKSPVKGGKSPVVVGKSPAHFLPTSLARELWSFLTFQALSALFCELG